MQDSATLNALRCVQRALKVSDHLCMQDAGRVDVACVQLGWLGLGGARGACQLKVGRWRQVGALIAVGKGNLESSRIAELLQLGASVPPGDCSIPAAAALPLPTCIHTAWPEHTKFFHYP